jgi:hypothetical protein
LFLSPPFFDDARILFAHPDDVFSRGAGWGQLPNASGQYMNMQRWQADAQGAENFVQFGIDVLFVRPTHFSTNRKAGGEFKSLAGCQGSPALYLLIGRSGILRDARHLDDVGAFRFPAPHITQQ